MNIQQPVANGTQKPTENNNVDSQETKKPSMAEQKEIDMNAPYTDVRKITISPVRNYSWYRNVNALALGTPKLVIGSSVTSSRVLSSNKDEVEVYFPALLGLNPTHPSFMQRVKAWLSNIRFIVTDNSELDITFEYNHYSDYLEVKRQEEAINKEYDEADKVSIERLENALKTKITNLNALEAKKAKYGRPRNVEQYLIYRHCLLYKDVAKDTALINTDPTIRFYIRDEQKEKEREEKLLKARQTAMRNYVEVLGDDTKFNSIYVQCCVNQGFNLTEYSLKTKYEKEKVLLDYSNDKPEKFNKLCSDKFISTKALIEMLIARGELSRSELNQNIYTSDGDFIAANIKEAVVYFNNPENKDIRTSYENKLKMF